MWNTTLRIPTKRSSTFIKYVFLMKLQGYQFPFPSYINLYNFAVTPSITGFWLNSKVRRFDFAFPRLVAFSGIRYRDEKTSNYYVQTSVTLLGTYLCSDFEWMRLVTTMRLRTTYTICIVVKRRQNCKVRGEVNKNSQMFQCW